MAYASATFAGLKPVYGGIQGDPFPGKTVTTRKPGQFYIDSEPVGVPNATTCRINPQDIGKTLAHDGVGETVQIWHPSDIPGLTMALLPDPTTMVSDIDFSIPAGIGEPVRAWLDSSGNGNHAEQTTANQQPRRGFLGAKGNLLRHSNDLTNPVWNKNWQEEFNWEPSDEKDPVGGTPIRIWVEAGSGRGSWGVRQAISTLPGMQVQIRVWVKALTDYPITPSVLAFGGSHEVGGRPAITIDDGWVIRQAIPTWEPGRGTEVGVCSNSAFNNLPLDVNYLVGSVVCTDVSWGHWIYNVYTTDEAVIPQEGDYPAAVCAGYTLNTSMELNPEIFQGDWEIFKVDEVNNRQASSGVGATLDVLTSDNSNVLRELVLEGYHFPWPSPHPMAPTAVPRRQIRTGDTSRYTTDVTRGGYIYQGKASIGPESNTGHGRWGSMPWLWNMVKSGTAVTSNYIGRYEDVVNVAVGDADRASLWGISGMTNSSRSNISAVITYDRNLTEQERNRINDFLQVACKIHLPGPGR